jgi:thiol-activated cytolysin
MRRHALAILVPLLGSACSRGAAADGFGAAGWVPDAEETSSTGIDTEGIPTDDDALDAFIVGLGHFAVADFSPKQELPCVGDDCPVDGPEDGLFCEYVHYGETAHFDELVALQPGAVSLWPGAVVRGADALQGLLTPINAARAPLTFSVSLENLGGSPVAMLDDPSLSAFRAARNQILATGVTGATAAQVAFDIEIIHEFEQLGTSVGFGAGFFGVAEVDSLFDFHDEQRRTKILVDFTQAYYTIDIDPPDQPSDLFLDEVTVADVEGQMGTDDPPMIVQSITYGRRVLFAFESSLDAHAVRTAVEAGFDAFLFSGGVSVDSESAEILEQTRMTALILGGSGETAVAAIGGFEGLLGHLAAGGDYSAESPGAPIAYQLAYLDNTATTLAFTSDWSERNCFDETLDVTVDLVEMNYIGGNDGGHVQVFGELQGRVAAPGEVDACRPDAEGWFDVFRRDRGGTVDVFGVWQPPAPLSFTQWDVPTDAAAQLCLRGRLFEADSGLFEGDDDFGEASIGPLLLEHGWAGDHVLQFAQDGEIHATLRVAVD